MPEEKLEMLKKSRRIFSIYNKIKENNKEIADEKAVGMAITQALDDIKEKLMSSTRKTR